MNSSDYHPEKFTAELLNIVTPSLDKDEDKQQVNALSSHMVRALIKPVTVRHHDFTIFGHIHAMIDHADDSDVKNVLQAIDLSIVKFLTNQLKNEENEVLKIDAF